MKQPKQVQQFWQAFLQDTGCDPQTEFFECFHFCTDEASADDLLKLVLEGKKKATSSSGLAYQGEQKPKVGDYSIVTDWGGMPHCVIRTTAVRELPFRKMTFELCKREGEDASLESWQRGHIHFFTEEGKQAGYQFDWDMPVIFEDFEVVYRNNDET